MLQACNPNTLCKKAAGSRVQGHPRLEFKASYLILTLSLGQNLTVQPQAGPEPRGSPASARSGATSFSLALFHWVFYLRAMSNIQHFLSFLFSFPTLSQFHSFNYSRNDQFHLRSGSGNLPQLHTCPRRGKRPRN